MFKPKSVDNHSASQTGRIMAVFGAFGAFAPGGVPAPSGNAAKEMASAPALQEVSWHLFCMATAMPTFDTNP